MSIRRRLTITLVGILLVILAAAGTGLYLYVAGALAGQFDESLIAKAKLLNSLLRVNQSGKVEFDFSDNAMPEFGLSQSPEYFELWFKDGTKIERSKSLEKLDLKLPSLAATSPELTDLVLPDGRKGRLIQLRISPTVDSDDGEDQKVPIEVSAANQYILSVARDREGLDRTLRTIRSAIMGLAVVLATIFGILVPWLVARNLRALNKIAAQASRISVDALNTRFPVETVPDELKPICQRLNDSLARIQGAFERERRFSADVAHELRTPIAELRLLSELALKFPKDESEINRSFRDALDIAQQMEAIVETLLEMMVSDVPASPNLKSTNLLDALNISWRNLESRAAEKKISLIVKSSEYTLVQSDSTVLGRILSNLLSNAVEYSPAGATIEWEQKVYPDRVLVTLSNPTKDLVEDDLSHMTEPFWRKDASRTGNSHSGLGLALVASYAKRLNIKLNSRLPSPGVFETALEFPR